VRDLFGRNGSTLIAAEQIKRPGVSHRARPGVRDIFQRYLRLIRKATDQISLQFQLTPPVAIESTWARLVGRRRSKDALISGALS
jgi:hypothetical protein